MNLRVVHGAHLCCVLFHPLPVNMVGLAGFLSRPTTVLWDFGVVGPPLYRLVVFICLYCAVT